MKNAHNRQVQKCKVKNSPTAIPLIKVQFSDIEVVFFVNYEINMLNVNIIFEKSFYYKLNFNDRKFQHKVASVVEMRHCPRTWS